MNNLSMNTQSAKEAAIKEEQRIEEIQKLVEANKDKMQGQFVIYNKNEDSVFCDIKTSSFSGMRFVKIEELEEKKEATVFAAEKMEIEGTVKFSVQCKKEGTIILGFLDFCRFFGFSPCEACGSLKVIPFQEQSETCQVGWHECQSCKHSTYE